MDLFPGFAWPIPRAFASAVATCRFEQGDVLYDHPIAYAEAGVRGGWGAAVAVLGHHIQVLDPPRSGRLAPSDSSGSRFLANWEAPVGFELCDYRAGRTEMLESTQGRLFSCLWRGDLGLLAAGESDSTAPTPPALARALHSQLEGAVPALRAAASERTPKRSRKRTLIFAFAVDESSEGSLSKARAIESALRPAQQTDPIDVSALEAGLAAGRDFHPALRIRACVVRADDEQAVRDLLKGVLYAPTRDAQPAPGTSSGEARPAPDRFRLERHGLLFESRPGDML